MIMSYDIRPIITDSARLWTHAFLALSGTSGRDRTASYSVKPQVRVSPVAKNAITEKNIKWQNEDDHLFDGIPWFQDETKEEFVLQLSTHGVTSTNCRSSFPPIWGTLRVRTCSPWYSHSMASFFCKTKSFTTSCSRKPVFSLFLSSFCIKFIHNNIKSNGLRIALCCTKMHIVRS